jgi:hypothetical protein
MSARVAGEIVPTMMIVAIASTSWRIAFRPPLLEFLARLFFGLPTLLSQPMMFRNPFLRFCSGIKLAEVARSVVWPRHFDAPIAPLHDWL